MGVTTWLDRITDESNLWLSAAKAEEAGTYPEAAVLYLTDASACLERGSNVRGALSCFCAAECLWKMGASSEAKRLYIVAGELYATIADHGVSGSIREGLWALQRSYACYVFAGELKESEAVLESFKLLSQRANPFSGIVGWMEMPAVSPRLFRDGSVQLPVKLGDIMGKFLALKSSRSGASRRPVRRKATGAYADDQESFVSQLG